MLIFIGILFTLFILVFSVLNNIFLGYGLTISLLFFTFIGLKRGYSLKKIGMLYWIETKILKYNINPYLNRNAYKLMVKLWCDF